MWPTNNYSWILHGSWLFRDLLPECCECGIKYSIEHSVSCKKRGFVSIRYNVRNVAAVLLSEIYVEMFAFNRVYSSLLVKFKQYHICRYQGFWITAQTTFFDVMVFSPITKRYNNQELAKFYEQNK